MNLLVFYNSVYFMHIYFFVFFLSCARLILFGMKVHSIIFFCFALFFFCTTLISFLLLFYFLFSYFV